MDRRGLLTVTAVLVAGACIGAACGNDELSDDPLPPMYTTTTSTTIVTTTTEYVAPIYVVQAGDLLANIANGRWGGLLNEIAVLLFLAMVVFAVVQGRRGVGREA